MPTTPSTHLQLVAALAAMSEANLALRQGILAAPAISRAARCLEALADCPDLGPAMRRLFDSLSTQWANAIAPRVGGGPAEPIGAGAAVLPLRDSCR
jgi:CTP:molybdopterin cytidylyltransferase MocA